jgi:hypothetical protein
MDTLPHPQPPRAPALSTPWPAALAPFEPLPRWVLWREEWRDGRLTKRPIRWDGRAASSTNPADWQPLDVNARARGDHTTSNGVGIVLGPLPDGSTLAGVDLDTCRTAGGFAPWAQAVLDAWPTYAEVSPSGTGAKMLFRLDAADMPAVKAMLGGRDGRKWSGAGNDHPEAIELYTAGRYFAVTGEALNAHPVRALTAADVDWLARHAEAAFARAGGFDFAARDNSRSARAFRLAGAVQREGGTKRVFVERLKADDALAGWLDEKGVANGAREVRRAWERAGEPEPWPAPQLALASDDPLPAPPWPAHLLPGDWAAVVDRAALASGAPPDFTGMAIIGAAGACIGNARWGHPWGDWAEPSVLNVALVGGPSSSKTPALSGVQRALSDLEADANADFEERMREYRTKAARAKEERAAWEAEVKQAVKLGCAAPLEPHDAKAPEVPQRRRIMSGQPTPEAAARLSAGNPRGLVLVRDELAGWLGDMDRYSSGGRGGERAFWLQAWNGGRWQPDRVKDEADVLDVPHLAWGVLGGIQPDRLGSAMLSGDDDGLPARFLFAWPAQKPVSAPNDASVRHVLAERLRRLWRLPWTPSEPVRLPFTSEARDGLQRLREEVARLEGGVAGVLVGWVGKLPGFAVRLAVVFAHLEWAEHGRGDPPAGITGEHVERASRFLLDYGLPMARRVMGEAALPEAERDARRLARWYLAQKPPRPSVLNARVLRRQADGPGIPSAERLTAALHELEALGWVRPAPARAGGTSGRQRADWEVNASLDAR